MILTYDTIKSITQGAVRTEQTENGISFFRFTPEETALYKELKSENFLKVFTTSGICLEFETDSRYLYLDTNIRIFSSRSFYAVDILADGILLDSLCNFCDGDAPLEKEYKITVLSKRIELPHGTKRIKIVFPQLAALTLKELSLDDNSFVKPVGKKPLLYMYGDSITQGFDAMHPTHSYAYRLADKIGAELVCKAIGGEVHFPQLASCEPLAVPDYITVAYGTNDWSHCSLDEFKSNCESFYKNLTQNYPDSKIFAITPIWRKDYCDYKQMGDFKEVGEFIKEAVKGCNNVTVIDGFDFVPKEEAYFSDLYLHPTDEGFAHYAENLYKAICGLL